MKDGEFSLRKWNSNCQSFRDKIKQDEEKKSRSAIEAFPKGSEITQNLNKDELSSTKDGKLETKQLTSLSQKPSQLLNDLC